METEGSLPCSQKPVTRPYPHSVHIFMLFLEDTF